MTRRSIPFFLAASVVEAQSTPSADSMLSILRSGMETKKGVTLFVRGQTVAILVTAIGDHFVEGRNQQSSRVVVRIASIDAAAIA